MKANRILFLCSVVALPQLAMADVPNPQGLGTVQAILTFCAEVDPRDAASFQQEWTSVTAGTTNQQLGGAEGGSGYQQAFDATTGELKQMSRSVVATACAAGAAQWKGSDDGRSGKNKDGQPGKDSGEGRSGKDKDDASPGKSAETGSVRKDTY